MTTNDNTSVSPPSLTDPTATEQEITTFIRDVVRAADTEGVVVGLSGGIDSTVSATLAVEALGSEAVDGLVLPAAPTADENVRDAIKVAEELLIDYRRLDVQPVVDRIVRLSTMQIEETRPRAAGTDSTRHITVDPGIGRGEYRRAVGNATARLRMLLTYFEANVTNRLVLGTGNRTELLLGYFTKYGDGGVDLLPIGDLYKTEVRELAAHLGVPRSIREKPPAAELWIDQTDEVELGAPYPVIDAVLEKLVNEACEGDEIVEELDVTPDVVERCVDLYAATAHKRRQPPTPRTHRAQRR